MIDTRQLELIKRVLVSLMISVPIFLSAFSLKYSEKFDFERLVERSLNENKRDLEVTIRAGMAERQLGFATTRFARMLQETFQTLPENRKNLKAGFFETEINRILKAEALYPLQMVKHEVAVVATTYPANGSPVSELIFRTGDRLGMESCIAEIGSYLSEAHRAVAILAPRKANREMDNRQIRLSMLINNLIKQVTTINLIGVNSHSQLRLFQGIDSKTGFFWRSFKPGDKHDYTVEVYLLIEYQQLPTDFVPLSISKTWNSERDEDSAIGFFTDTGRLIAASNGFPTDQIGNMRPLPQEFNELDSFLTDSGWLVSVANQAFGHKSIIWVARKIQPAEPLHHGTYFQIAILLTLLPILVFPFRKALPAVFSLASLNHKIVASFVFASILPLIHFYNMTRTVMKADLRFESWEAQELLEDGLGKLDSGIQDTVLQITSTAVEAFNSERFIADLSRCEEIFSSRSDLEPLRKLFMTEIESLQQKNPALISGILMGVNGSTVTSHEKSSDEHSFADPLSAFANLVLPALNPELKVMPPPTPDKKAPTLNEIIEELFDKLGTTIISDLLGMENFKAFVGKPGMVFKTLIGREGVLIHPFAIEIENAIKNMIVMVYDSSRTGLLYTHGLGTKFRVPDIFDNSETGASFISVDRWNQSVVSQEPDLDDRMFDTALMSDLLNTSISVFDTEQESLIMSRPGTHNPRSVFVGKMSLRPFIEFHRKRRNMLAIVLYSTVIVFLIVAVLASASFMVPVRELTKALEMVTAEDYSVSVSVVENNELGLLAKSFNRMASGLREGKILGRYVSDSAKAAAREGNLDKLAGEAKNIEATVVFCGLTGFTDLESDQNPEEMIEVLQAHFDIVAQAAQENRAEIDKIFGEKAMVVFDHQSFSDACQAVDAAITFALAVARKNRKTQKLSHNKTAIGINTGPVLSGILGSPLVHLDMTVIGDTVNLAARLATLAQITSESGIVISGDTKAAASASLKATKLPFKKVKGKQHEVEVFLLDLI